MIITCLNFHESGHARERMGTGSECFWEVLDITDKIRHVVIDIQVF